VFKTCYKIEAVKLKKEHTSTLALLNLILVLTIMIPSIAGAGNASIGNITNSLTKAEVISLEHEEDKARKTFTARYINNKGNGWKFSKQPEPR